MIHKLVIVLNGKRVDYSISETKRELTPEDIADIARHAALKLAEGYECNMQGGWDKPKKSEGC